MHPEAYEGFQWALKQSKVLIPMRARVLDVGGQYVNGSVHELLPMTAQITTLDLENADIVADARYWEPDQSYDVVMATEVFEHVREWPLVLGTMVKALAPQGVLLATCASTGRPAHGATGAPLPARGEWYGNVPIADIEATLASLGLTFGVRYRHPPGDAYMWARRS